VNHIGDANKMVSDTPRTDAAYFKDCATMYDLAGEMKRMERELNAANAKIKQLRDGIYKQGHEIEQTCGKALGYQLFKDDQKNFPGSTEEDGVCVGDHVAETIVSELAKRHTEALARINRLEQSGDALEKWLDRNTPITVRNDWQAAREDRP
jgi:hypothetical protein